MWKDWQYLAECQSLLVFTVQDHEWGLPVVWWLRIHLIVRGCRFEPWSGNQDPPWCRVTEPMSMSHSKRACVPQPRPSAAKRINNSGFKQTVTLVGISRPTTGRKLKRHLNFGWSPKIIVLNYRSRDGRDSDQSVSSATCLLFQNAVNFETVCPCLLSCLCIFFLVFK